MKSVLYLKCKTKRVESSWMSLLIPSSAHKRQDTFKEQNPLLIISVFVEAFVPWKHPHELKGMEHLAALPALRRQVLQQATLWGGGETFHSSFMDPVGGSSCRESKMTALLARNCNLG